MRPLVTDLPVEFEKQPVEIHGIYGTYLKSMKLIPEDHNM